MSTVEIIEFVAIEWIRQYGLQVLIIVVMVFLALLIIRIMEGKKDD